MNNTPRTIYRIESMLAFIGGQYVDSDDVIYFYKLEDAQASLRMSWSQVTLVDFLPLNHRAGFGAFGVIEDSRRLLGVIVPVEIGAIIHDSPQHL